MKGRTTYTLVNPMITSRTPLGQEFRDWLKTNFPNPGINSLPKQNKYTAPMKGYKRLPSDIGRAYESLLILTLKLCFEKSFNLKKGPTAFKAKDIVKGRTNELVYIKHKDIFDNYESHLSESLSKKELSDEFIMCICYSEWEGYRDFYTAEDCYYDQWKSIVENLPREYFDPEVRANKFYAYYDEVRGMFRNSSYDLFNPSERITYSGNINGVLGGYFDLIVDDCVIDIKTNIKYGLNRHDLNQIICYFFLIKIYGLNRQPFKLNKMGIYLARYDYLWTFDFQEIPLVELDRLTSEFKEFLCKIGAQQDIRRNYIFEIEEELEEIKEEYRQKPFYPKTREQVESEFLNGP